MVAGIGTDIVDTARVRGLIDRHGDRFLHRWFGEEEIVYCRGKAKPHLHFAARLAAKEAVFKALALNASTPLCWLDITIGGGKDKPPSVELRGVPRMEAQRLRITAFHLSLSHCDSYAVATVVAERLT